MTSILTSCMLLTVLAGQAQDQVRCPVYMYLDDQGNSVRTRKYDSIPPTKRDSVITFQDCSARLEKKASFSYTQASEEPGALFEEASISDWFRRRHRELERWQVIVVLLSLAVFLGGLIGIVVVAFRISVLWGLGGLLLPLVPVVFILMHWRDTRVPFLAWLLGWISISLFGYLI